MAYHKFIEYIVSTQNVSPYCDKKVSYRLIPSVEFTWRADRTYAGCHQVIIDGEIITIDLNYILYIALKAEEYSLLQLYLGLYAYCYQNSGDQFRESVNSIIGMMA